MARRTRPERALAEAETDDGVVAGTRTALRFGDHELPWERVERADWDAEAGVLTVVEVGTWGVARPVHRFALREESRLLQLVRERVTASVVLQRRVVVTGRRGLTVLGRRPPAGGEVAWYVEYDAGVDPDDPAVAELADAALTAARGELG